MELLGLRAKKLIPLERRAAILCTSISWVYIMLIDVLGNIIASARISPYEQNNVVYIVKCTNKLILYTRIKSEEAFLSLINITENYPIESWRIKIDEKELNVGFPIEDVDGDGTPDVLAIKNENVAFFSGFDGSLICSTKIKVSYIKNLASTGSGVFICTSNGRGFFISYEKNMETERWSLKNVYDVTIVQDVDGDGKKEIVIAGNESVICYWGSYDNEPPKIELVEPKNKTSISTLIVTLRARVLDSQSGVARVFFEVDGKTYEAIYDSNLGVYEVCLNVTSGRHEWRIWAVDKVGHEKLSENFYFTVNLTVFGGPSWTDDLIFITTLIAVLVLSFCVAYKLSVKRN